jgi:hypothetical protein
VAAPVALEDGLRLSEGRQVGADAVVEPVIESVFEPLPSLVETGKTWTQSAGGTSAAAA